MKTWLDGLIRLYEETDPALGEASETQKLERARQAIELWWYVYRYLMVWAQSQIVGYEWAKQNPEELTKLAIRMNIDNVHVDSHLLEYIGMVQVYNQVNNDDPLFNKVADNLEEMNSWSLDDTTLRSVIRELLVSRSTESSFWRFPLQEALHSLNLGEVKPIVQPIPVKRQGSPTILLMWKTRALCHVHFKVGQGLKKYVALENVASAIGQSVETLRSWEKSLLADEDRADDLYAAGIAGKHLELVESPPSSKVARAAHCKLTEELSAQYFRNMPLVYRARWQLEELKRYPLDKVRAGILASRKPTKMVRKDRVAVPKNR